MTIRINLALGRRLSYPSFVCLQLKNPLPHSSIIIQQWLCTSAAGNSPRFQTIQEEQTRWFISVLILLLVPRAAAPAPAVSYAELFLTQQFSTLFKHGFNRVLRSIFELHKFWTSLSLSRNGSFRNTQSPTGRQAVHVTALNTEHYNIITILVYVACTRSKEQNQQPRCWGRAMRGSAKEENGMPNFIELPKFAFLLVEERLINFIRPA